MSKVCQSFFEQSLKLGFIYVSPHLNIVDLFDLQMNQAQSGQNEREEGAEDQGCDQPPSKQLLL